MNLGIESETLEFKKSTGEIEKAVDNIASMLNKHGHGTLFFWRCSGWEDRHSQIKNQYFGG